MSERFTCWCFEKFKKRRQRVLTYLRPVHQIENAWRVVHFPILNVVGIIRELISVEMQRFVEARQGHCCSQGVDSPDPWVCPYLRNPSFFPSHPDCLYGCGSNDPS